MNKKTKGAIAAGSAALLLAGGAGTFAVWSDSETVGGASISSGNLSLEAGSSAEWKVNGATLTSGYKAKPGDVFTLDTDVTIRASGDNLSAELTATNASWDPSSAQDLVDALGAATITVDDASVDPDNITSDDDGATIGVTASFTFDADNTDAQDMNAILDGVTLTLTQK